MGINIKENKFIFIRETSDEGMIIAEDGGLICLHHNGEYVMGTHYGRMNLDTVKKLGMQAGLEELYEDESMARELFDFEGQDDITLGMLEELADWLICPRQGVFLDNLTFIDETQKEELEDKDLIKFLQEGVTQEQD